MIIKKHRDFMSTINSSIVFLFGVTSGSEHYKLNMHEMFKVQGGYDSLGIQMKISPLYRTWFSY